VEGAFRLTDARIDSPSAPEIVFAMRWKPDPSSNGTPGLICSDYSGYGPGGGMHGSLSRFDLHNTCVASGPDFRKGAQDDLPTGNIDIAPTILWILGVEPDPKPSGRVLTEALAQEVGTQPVCEHRRREATFDAQRFTWRQYLDSSVVDGVLYFNEGNGEQVARSEVGGN
jgi:hypothetical protein